MPSMLFSLPELFNSYKNWVIRNPQTTSEFETSVKWISYFIAGRSSNSQVVSELVYSLSNLVILFNDRIITNARHEFQANTAEKVKVWLSTLEYCEVFLELSSEKYWGNVGRWIIIISIQILKCISRILLVFHYKEAIVQSPAIAVLQRHKFENASDIMLPNQAYADSISFTLRRSGKVMRKVDASPPISLRTWKPLEEHCCDNKQTIEPTLVNKQLLAETLYILKPIVHLGAVGCFGSKSWTQWMIPLLIDLYSLHIYSDCQRTDRNSLTPQQNLQVSRRNVALLLYLLRSPFYERHSKERIEAFLLGVAKRIPLTGLICMPLIKYLPFWQRTYFYMWST